LARDLSVAGASVLFSMWVTFASGYQVVYQALVVILAGLILYAFLNARRQRLGESPEPADLPDDLAATAAAAIGLPANGNGAAVATLHDQTSTNEVKV